MADRPDQTALLCEHCGYVLDGLEDRTSCPECGVPIARSLPSARTGTPFQNDPTWRGLARQCAMLARRPGSLFGHARIGHSSDASLLFRSIAAASFAACAPTYALLIAASARGDNEELLIAGTLLACLMWGLLNVLLYTLTAIERAGITFFATRHGWRVPRPVAQMICANAAPGWIAAGVLFTLGLFAVPAMMRLARDLPPPWQTWAAAAAASLPLMGFVAGMIVFETLVFIGVRRCRYANWAALARRTN